VTDTEDVTAPEEEPTEESEDGPAGPVGLSCASCGTGLPAGSLRYIVELTMTADFDPVMVFPDDLEGDLETALEAVQEAANEGLAGELEEQVLARRAFLLCPACRKAFLESLPGGRLQ